MAVNSQSLAIRQILAGRFMARQTAGQKLIVPSMAIDSRVALYSRVIVWFTAGIVAVHPGRKQGQSDFNDELLIIFNERATKVGKGSIGKLLHTYQWLDRCPSFIPIINLSTVWNYLARHLDSSKGVMTLIFLKSTIFPCLRTFLSWLMINENSSRPAKCSLSCNKHYRQWQKVINNPNCSETPAFVPKSFYLKIWEEFCSQRAKSTSRSESLLKGENVWESAVKFMRRIKMQGMWKIYKKNLEFWVFIFGNEF